MSEQMTFTIEGEFITTLAREKFYEDDNLKFAIELLKGCTVTENLSEEEHVGICIAILDGKKELHGVYPGDDYGLRETPENDLGFYRHLEKMKNRKEELEESLKKANEKLLFMIDWITENGQVRVLSQMERMYERETGEFLFGEETRKSLDDEMPSAMLESYMKKAKAEREKNPGYNPDEDYGWLEPDGTYHPLEFGEHSEWAKEYVEEHYPRKKQMELYKEDGRHLVNGDFLVYRLGWVLIDNPGMGMPRAVYDTIKGLTKAQREFLYGHFKDRGMTDEANALYEED